MRTYKLSLGLISLSLLLEGCSLFSIDPDEIDIADDDEVGDTGVDTGVGTGEGTGDGDGDPAGTETGTIDDGSEATGTTDGTDGTESTTVNDASSDTGDTTDDTSGDSGTTDSSGTTGGTCEDFMGLNACGDCVSAECCDPLLACVADAVCFCTFNCQIDGGSEQACVEMCGPTNALVDDLSACTVMACGDLCL